MVHMMLLNILIFLTINHREAFMSTISYPRITFVIPENEPAGLLVGNIIDKLQQKRRINIYSETSFILQSVTKDSLKYFKLTRPKSSIISTRRIIDLERLCRLKNSCQNGYKLFDLIAKIDPSDKYRHEIRIQINVTDVNDNQPYFVHNIFRRSIKETIFGPGKKINLPLAYDKDVSLYNRLISYNLTYNPNHYFNLSISADSKPRLIINKHLDAEKLNLHKLILVAWNSNYPDNYSASLTILIKIDDLNDNQPIFSKPIYRVPVMENTGINRKIFQLRATDKDSSSKLYFSIDTAAPLSISNTFSVAPDGVVTLLTKLDYEKRRLYSVPVKVTDGEFTSNSELQIVVMDINDCAPEFSLIPDQLIVAENTPVDTVIGQMNVFDRDSVDVDSNISCNPLSKDQPMRFSTFQSSLQNPNRELKANIFLHHSLDRDTVFGNTRTSLVVCTDLGVNQSQLTATFTVTLIVKDKNDNWPVFSQNIYNAKIEENLNGQKRLIKVSADDADSGDNALITYSLIFPNHKDENELKDLFQIDKLSGQIFAMKSLDRERRSHYKILVVANDNSLNETRHSSTATVQIRVLDKNDCEPTIKASSKSLAVYENKPKNFRIGTVEAEDCDEGLNSNLLFDLIPSINSYMFSLEPNGTLNTLKTFDREKEDQQKFCLHIRVRDLGENCQSSRSAVCIQVLDENDNAPRIKITSNLLPIQNMTVNITIPRIDYNFQLSKQELKNTLVLKYETKDADEGDNALVDVYLKEQQLSMLNNKNSQIQLNRFKRSRAKKNLNVKDTMQQPLFLLNATRNEIRLVRQWKDISDDGNYEEDSDRILLFLEARDRGKPMLITKKTVLLKFTDIAPLPRSIAFGDNNPYIVNGGLFGNGPAGKSKLEASKIKVMIIIVLVPLSILMAIALLGAIACMMLPGCRARKKNRQRNSANTSSNTNNDNNHNNIHELRPNILQRSLSSPLNSRMLFGINNTGDIQLEPLHTKDGSQHLHYSSSSSSPLQSPSILTSHQCQLTGFDCSMNSRGSESQGGFMIEEIDRKYGIRDDMEHHKLAIDPDHCNAEHNWSLKIDKSGRDLKGYFTLPPQVLTVAAAISPHNNLSSASPPTSSNYMDSVTKQSTIFPNNRTLGYYGNNNHHEEQRSDSGRGASDEDNPSLPGYQVLSSHYQPTAADYCLHHNPQLAINLYSNNPSNTVNYPLKSDPSISATSSTASSSSLLSNCIISSPSSSNCSQMYSVLPTNIPLADHLLTKPYQNTTIIQHHNIPHSSHTNNENQLHTIDNNNQHFFPQNSSTPNPTQISGATPSTSITINSNPQNSIFTPTTLISIPENEINIPLLSLYNKTNNNTTTSQYSSYTNNNNNDTSSYDEICNLSKHIDDLFFNKQSTNNITPSSTTVDHYKQNSSFK